MLASRQASQGVAAASLEALRAQAWRVRGQAGGRPTLPVILKDKSAVVLYKAGDGDVYCSDANSTAFKFPLIDAKLLERARMFYSPSQWPRCVARRVRDQRA